MICAINFWTTGLKSSFWLWGWIVWGWSLGLKNPATIWRPMWSWSWCNVKSKFYLVMIHSQECINSAPSRSTSEVTIIYLLRSISRACTDNINNNLKIIFPRNISHLNWTVPHSILKVSKSQKHFFFLTPLHRVFSFDDFTRSKVLSDWWTFFKLNFCHKKPKVARH